MADAKISEVIPDDLLSEYELNKDHLKNVTVSDINNITQAFLEMHRKGAKPRGGGCQMCTCGMCTCS
jgi:hypothetical protein